jgi:integrase
MDYAEIRAHMIQGCIDSQTAAGGGHKIRNLFVNLDKFAMELDVIEKRYSDLTRVATAERKREKTIFSDIEVARLWNNINTPWVDTILILLYSGWRISEFLSLTKENVHIDPTGKTVNTMRGGQKTRAGKDRIVPIHSAILPLVQVRHDSAKNHLIEMRPGKMISIRHYRRHWDNIMGIIDARHSPHETRHTFRSWLDAANAPLSCANRIMGHVCGDIGLQVYTHKTIEDLRAAIELIKSEHAYKREAVSNT